MGRGRAGQRSRGSARRAGPDGGSAAAPPATGTSPTPPAVPTAADRPRLVATDIPAVDPRRQPHRPAKRTIPPAAAPRTAAAAPPRPAPPKTAAAAHPGPAATPKPPQHLPLEGCCDDRLSPPAAWGNAGDLG